MRKMKSNSGEQGSVMGGLRASTMVLGEKCGAAVNWVCNQRLMGQDTKRKSAQNPAHPLQG